MKELIVTRNGIRQAGTSESGDMVRRLKRAAERSLYVFSKAILGWRLLFPVLHGEWCQFIQLRNVSESDAMYQHISGGLDGDWRRKGMLAPRGTFKTTLAKSLVMHMTIQPEEHNVYFPGILGANTRILYCAETSDRAETRIRYLKETYEHNKLLRGFWPEVVWEDPTQAKAKWNQQRLLLRRTENFDECTVERTGVDAAITGGHFDAFIKDDLISLAARNEASTMQKAIDWNHSSAALVNDPNTYLEWYFGTRWGAFDLYTDVMEIDPEVVWYTRAAIEDGEPIDPKRHPLRELARLRRVDEDLFFLNYMNTTTGSKMQDFNMKDVRDFTLRDGVILYDALDGDADLMQLFQKEVPDEAERLLRTKWS